MLYYIIYYFGVLHYNVYIILYSVKLYDIMFNYIVLFEIILYYVKLYYIIQNDIINYMYVYSIHRFLYYMHIHVNMRGMDKSKY